MNIEPIAYYRSLLPTKFGVPRQSGLVAELKGKIVFQQQCSNPDALRGLKGYSHLWIIWQFSKSEREAWSPTVRPPRLGGNKHMGVFATRSPFRPNPIGLSSVKFLGIEHSDTQGDVILVAGVDMLNGTPIYDIKPYLSYTDSHPEAVCGFADDVKKYHLPVFFPEELLEKVAPDKRKALLTILENDPRPSYIEDSDREYGMTFAELDVFFKVQDGTLNVTRIETKNKN